ncbi:telomere repeats-binding bouquet formation protein 2 isoform X1 [Trematomus bernacchii]|uniref:telomere repeats-binding bouquet formation protein 2 isoform X1 n=1 Tax=Trematomus bernacchii TaxID=40690 RepID=UPI00146B16CF|nr:telomere repeats-binding bouquet formation protein 2 isoform X1 [Trematomus bernacchii]
MFKNKSAWFSSSVPQACHNFWRLEGGSIAGCRTADYLFSEDATCADTMRIFESKDYLWNKVAVFHSLFLSACERRQSVKSVCIGHYVLPPASVQDEVRQVVGRLIWEFEDEQSVAQGFSSQTEDECSEVSKSNSGPSDTESESEAPQSVHYPVTDMRSGYISMDNLQKYSGDLCDFHPGSLRCSHCKGHCCPLHT